MTLSKQRPSLDIDIFDDAVILDRYPVYQRLRDAGPAVYIEPHSIWAIGRYADIREASLDVERFSSARGVEMLEDLAKMGTVGTILGLLASGKSRERILQAYPYLEPEDIDAALAYAAWRLEEREEPLVVV